MEKTYTFETLPQSADELQNWSGYDTSDAFCVAAMSIAAFARYMEDKDAGIAMLNHLKGPQPLSQHEIQFLRDRAASGYTYVPVSYFKGAVPGNNYTPDKPFTITVTDNPYSYSNEGYNKLFVQSGGADSARFITLRHKPSTGEWFLWEWMGVLSGIRIPTEQDPWA